MTREVVTVGPETSAKYAAELLADRGFAALPVVDEQDRLIGIVAEADVLRDRLPADPRLHLRADLLRLVEGYTGDLDSWEVTVDEGVATVRRVRGVPEVSADTEARALRALARTVSGVVGVRVLPAARAATGRAAGAPR